MGKLSILEELEKLGELRDKGILTEEEFAAQKAKLLNSADAAGGAPQSPQEGQAEPQQQQPQAPQQPQQQPQPHQPSIVIQQSSMPSASSSAAAAAASSGDGFWGTLLKIVGGIFVLSIILATCTLSGRDKKTEKQEAVQQQASSVVAEPVETPRDVPEENLEAKLGQAQADYAEAEIRLNKVWKEMDAGVREHLKREQVAWNRDKESTCNLYAKENGQTQQERDIFRLDCWTDKSDQRTSELIALEKQLLPQIQKAQKEQLEKSSAVAIAEIEKVHAAWSEVPDDIKQQLEGDFAGWKDEVTSTCFPEGKDSVQDVIKSNECVTKAAQKKLKEINGYKI